jgi:hypothetical protein
MRCAMRSAWLTPHRIDDARDLYVSRNALIGDQIDFLPET